MTHSWKCDSFVTNMTHSWNVTPSCVTFEMSDALTCLCVYVCGICNWLRLTHMCGMMLGGWWISVRDSFIVVQCMTYSCVWHDSIICVTWLVYMCDMTHLYVWHIARGMMNISLWLIYKCDAPTCSYVLHSWFNYTHSCVWHHARGIMNISSWLLYICGICASSICATWLIRMCDMTHSYVWHDSLICVT